MWRAAVVRYVVSSCLIVKDGLMTVLATVPPAGDVQPAVAKATAVLEEQLIEVGVLDQPLEPVTRHCFGGHREVGGLAVLVLRVADTSHGLVQLLATEAAGHANGFAVVLAQGLQHFATQVAQGQHLLVTGFITDAKALGGNTLGELAQLEVFRQA